MKAIFTALLIGASNFYENRRSYFSCDFKMQNIVLGLGSHSSSHPCGYCNKHKDCNKKNCNQCIENATRTIGSICEQNHKFVASGSKNPSNFDNCINQPLFLGPDSMIIFDLCPMDELHLFLGITKHIVDLLNEASVETGSKKGVRAGCILKPNFLYLLLTCNLQNEIKIFFY